MEEKIALFMRNLDISREEAIQLINDDKEVDHMTQRQLESDLTADQKETIKKMKNTTEKTVKTAVKREKKTDETKEELYNYLYSALESWSAEIAGSDNAREITVINGEGRKFKITISCPRS